MEVQRLNILEKTLKKLRQKLPVTIADATIFGLLEFRPTTFCGNFLSFSLTYARKLANYFTLVTQESSFGPFVTTERR